ncbi:MAG: hypothetical protein HGB04_08510 [Chlorobiaceae bacterium]|nr:hypothetical protein [Chlorobiaceae bacterium]
MAAFDFGRKLDQVTLDALVGREYHLDMRAAIEGGWRLFREHAGEFIGFTIILFLVSAVSSLFSNAGSLIVSAIFSPLSAGFIIATFRIMAGKEFHFNDLFTGFHHFLPLLLAGLATGCIVGAGFLLLIVPGIYFMVSYLFASAIVVDYGVEFWQAMEISRRLIGKHWFGLFGFMLVLIVINLLGLLALGIGMLVSIPVTSCAMAVAYRGVVGEHDGEW